MTVLEKILEWSRSRPNWQRDALRRLVLQGDLSEGDLVDLKEICKGEHGLCEQQEVFPLEKIHIPPTDAVAARVTLDSIFHQRGVNALAENLP